MLPSHPKRGLDESPDDMMASQDVPAKRPRHESPAPAASPAVAAPSPLVSPEGEDLDLDTEVSLPDAIEEPLGEAARKRRHSSDSAGSPSDEEDRDGPEGAPSRQRRHVTDAGFRLVLPEGFSRTIPSVVLDDGPLPLGPPAADRRGPLVEEVPYNAMAIVPYTGPPPLVALPAEGGGSSDDGEGTPPAESPPPPPSQPGMETEGDGAGNGVIEMLTPLECGSLDRMGSAASMELG